MEANSNSNQLANKLIKYNTGELLLPLMFGFRSTLCLHLMDRLID